LKGTSAVFCAECAVEAAQRLESLAHAGDFDAASSVAALVERECQCLMAALAKHTGT
jgi:hypothetical protein